MRLSALLVPAVACAAILFGASGCATPGEQAESGPASKGPHVLVDINSDPPNALIRVNNIRVGRAPVTVMLETNADGSMSRTVSITADYSTNPMTPNSTDMGGFEIQVGDFAPARVLFSPAGQGTVTSELTGRAITR